MQISLDLKLLKPIKNNRSRSIIIQHFSLLEHLVTLPKGHLFLVLLLIVMKFLVEEGHLINGHVVGFLVQDDVDFFEHDFVYVLWVSNLVDIFRSVAFVLDLLPLQEIGLVFLFLFSFFVFYDF